MVSTDTPVPTELDLPTLIPLEEARKLRAALLRWYDEEHRALPWRTKPSEYGTVISEFMLQQTQVATVLPYYEAFLKRFPSWKKLAEASEEDVLHAWSGLGYYRRARMLKRAAEVVVREFRGRLPHDPAQLAKLPGFGEYTVGAVGSIALNLRLPLVDGNVRRVISRIFALQGDLLLGAGKRRLWEICKELVDPARPGDFNQGLMELGATVCLPREPLCLVCPAFEQCRARQQGFPESFPAPIRRPKMVPVREVAVALLRGNKVLVLQRGDDSSFAGMWEFPRLDNRAEVKAQRAADEAEMAEQCEPGEAQAVEKMKTATNTRKVELDGQLTPARVLFDLLRIRGGKEAELLGSTEATFTNHRIKTELYRVQDRSVGAIRRQEHVAHKWVAVKSLLELPASKAQHRLFELLAQKPAN